MTELRSPGVKVIESLLPRDTGTVTTSPAVSVIIGYLQRGPLAPTVVTSWSQFRSVFGDWYDNPKEPFSPYPQNQVVDGAYQYFSNAPRGGAALYVCRVVNKTDSAPASFDVVDTTTSLPVGGDNVLFTVQAASPGAWGNRLAITITPSAQPGPEDFDGAEFNWEFSEPSPIKFSMSVYLSGTRSTDLVEQYSNLTLDTTSRQYVGNIINGISRYIQVTNVQDNASLWPDAIAASAPASLTGGLDGGTPTDSDFSDALSRLDSLEQSLTITAPGNPSLSINGLVAEYCRERGDSFCIIGAEDSDPVGMPSWAASLSKNAFAGVYYPDIFIPDPQAGPSGILRRTSNAGAVLGAFASNDASDGVWRSPAGTSAYLRTASAPTRVLTQTDLEALNSADAPVNVIRRVNGIGLCIMGARTLDQREADRYVGVRRSLSYIQRKLKDLTEFALFEPNGPDLWREVTTRLENWLGLYFQQGALRGRREPEAFYVTCDSSNNTAATVQAGELHITVGVAIENPAEFIIIRLTQSEGSVSVTAA